MAFAEGILLFFCHCVAVAVACGHGGVRGKFPLDHQRPADFACLVFYPRLVIDCVFAETKKKKHGVAGTGGFVGVVSPGFLCYFADGDD